MIDISQLTATDILNNAINVAKSGFRTSNYYFADHECCAIGASFRQCDITPDMIRHSLKPLHKAIVNANSAFITDIDLKLHETVSADMLRDLQLINDCTLNDEQFIHDVKELAQRYQVEL